MHAFTTMSKRRKLLFAVILGIAVLCLSMTAVFASKSTTKKASSSASKKSLTRKAKLASGAQAVSSQKGKAVAKQETVYVKADASGTRKATYVSDWLQNAGNEKNLEDISNLSNIENVKGYEKYTKNGNTLTWKTKGKDIYYRGTTDQTLPINVQILYELDGQSVTAKELAGKSGNVKITINYNNEGETNGITTPFAVATALDLPTSRFSNIKVTNGAVVSDGQNNAVVGIAFPGLKENLGLSSIQGLKIPDSVTITAKVKNFKLGPTITSASTDVLNRAGLKDIKSFKDLDAAIDKLETASGQLVAGTLSAYKGSAQLSAGAYVLSNGTDTLVTGLNQYTAGVASAANGGNTLASGSATLATGLGSLNNQVPALTGGITKLYAGSQQLATAYGDAKTKDTILNGSASLASGSASLNSHLKDLSSGAAQVDAGVQKVATLTSSLKQISAGLKSVNTGLKKLNLKQLQTIIGAYQDNLKTEGESAKVLSQVAQELYQNGDKAHGDTVAAQAKALSDKVTHDSALLSQAQSSLSSLNADDLSKLEAGIDQTTDGLDTATDSKNANSIAALSKGSKEVADGSKALAEKSPELATGSQKLDTALQKVAKGTNELNDGLAQLNGKTGDLSSGVGQLASGSQKIADGSKTLSDGLNTLNANSGALNSGASQLSSGSKQLFKGSVTLTDGLGTLYYGMNLFKTTGIDKIAAVYNNNFKNLAGKLNAIKQASEDYNNFSGITPGMKGSVNFIIETDSISK